MVHCLVGKSQPETWLKSHGSKHLWPFEETPSVTDGMPCSELERCPDWFQLLEGAWSLLSATGGRAVFAANTQLCDT